MALAAKMPAEAKIRSQHVVALACSSRTACKQRDTYDGRRPTDDLEWSVNNKWQVRRRRIQSVGKLRCCSWLDRLPCKAFLSSPVRPVNNEVCDPHNSTFGAVRTHTMTWPLPANCVGIARKGLAVNRSEKWDLVSPGPPDYSGVKYVSVESPQLVVQHLLKGFG